MIWAGECAKDDFRLAPRLTPIRVVRGVRCPYPRLGAAMLAGSSNPLLPIVSCLHYLGLSLLSVTLVCVSHLLI